VITGVRRSGKSELMRQFRQALVDDGVDDRDIVYLDLDDERYVIDTERMLYETIAESIRGDGAYVLIDEVQLVPGWERAVETARVRFKANVYVTGSNSQMTSSDLATHITGRYVEIHVLPLSFREFVYRYPIDRENGYTQRLEQYLKWGGMPIINLNDLPRKNTAILKAVYDSVVNEDIRSRVELEQGILDNITRFMMSSTGCLVSTATITSGSFIRDPRTTERYLGELCGSYLFYRTDSYDIVGRKHLSTKAKFYPVDTGLRNVRLKKFEQNIAAILEAAVYIELVRRGYEVSVGSFRSREVDFTAWDEEGEPEFIQVAYSVSDPSTLKRELAAFEDMEPGTSMTLITMDPDLPEAPEGVRVVRAVDWFLED
ncbi:MAG: ATP-binding protein, partial [Thermoplasmata archaeon]|nr:ATP-binding protein [Thermoplasmata archaeon]